MFHLIAPDPTNLTCFLACIYAMGGGGVVTSATPFNLFVLHCFLSNQQIAS